MTNLYANDTDVVFVRTGDADDPMVVQVDPGQPAPADALPEHVAQLKEAGALVEGKPKPPTVAEVLAEVGDDPVRAAAALDAERGGGNRKTLIEPLEQLVSAGTREAAEPGMGGVDS